MNTFTHLAGRSRPLTGVARSLIACGLALPAWAFAADSATNATEAIAVHAGYDRLRSRVSDDVNALDSAAHARAPTRLHIGWRDSAATRA